MNRGLAAVALAVVALVAIPASSTVTTTSYTVTYTGDGSTTTFSIPFPFLDSSHLAVVRIKISDSSETNFTEGVDYTVTRNTSSTGTLTTQGANSPISSAYKIKITRVVPLTQSTSFRSQGAFYPSSHEDAFDKLTMALQQVSGGVSQSQETSDALNAHISSSDDHTGYFYLTGRSGGQVAAGGTDAGDDLYLRSTSNASKGTVYLGDNNNLYVSGALVTVASSMLCGDTVTISGGLTTADITANGGAGALSFSATGSTIEMPDNTTDALCFGPSAGPTDLMCIGTTTGAESVTVTGTAGAKSFWVDAGTALFDEDVTVGGGVGAITFTDTASSIVLPDNDATALDIGSAGATNLLGFDTTDTAEKVVVTTSAVGNTALHVDQGTALFDEDVTVGGKIIAPNIYGSTASLGTLTISATTYGASSNGTITVGNITIDEASNTVGVNNTTPTEDLDVTGNVRATSYVIAETKLVGGSSASDNLVLDSTTSATKGEIQIGASSSPGQAKLKATGAFSVYIDGSGDTTALNVQSDGGLSKNKGISIQAGLDSPSADGDIVWIEMLDGAGGGRSQIRFISSGSPWAAFYGVSDARLKENVEPTDVDGLSVIRAIPLRQFDMKDWDVPHQEIGYIAQEVREVYPPMVSEGEDGYLMVADSVLMPVVVKAVQELADHGDSRDEQLDALAARVAVLEKLLRERGCNVPEPEPCRGWRCWWPW